MRNGSQQTPVQYQELPNVADQLEAIVASIECRLMEALTPQQFEMVQDLMEATRLLTEAELVLGAELPIERKSA